MKKMATVFLLILLLSVTVSPLFGSQKVELSPSTPYEKHIVYQNLALFLIGIAGLIVIIRMKLKEIERIQKMEAGSEEKEIPVIE